MGQTYKGDLRAFAGGTPVSYAIDPNLATPMDNGEFVAWDASNQTLIRFVRDGSAGKYVGISRDSQVALQKLGNQAQLKDFANPFSVFTTGIHEMLGTVGQTYEHGLEVYMESTNTQKITSTAGGGVKVGRVHLPGGQLLTGAVLVPILIDDYTVTQQ